MLKMTTKLSVMILITLGVDDLSSQRVKTPTVCTS